jgi:hypothetical protein
LFYHGRPIGQIIKLNGYDDQKSRVKTIETRLSIADVNVRSFLRAFG